MTALRLLIVDDEPLARRRLQLIVGRIGSDVEIVGQADGCDSAVAAIARWSPDILLLDIRMRDGTGFDVLDRMPPGCAPEVIFVTAFDDSAIRAFDASAADYLLKPVEGGRLAEAIRRARYRIELRDAEERMAEMRLVVDTLRAASHETGARRFEREFWIRGHRGAIARVEVDAIDWAGVEDDYVRLHTRSGSYLMRESMQRLMKRLDPDSFVRIHRATLVRLTSIERLTRERGAGVEVVLRCGSRLAAGRVYARQLTRRLGQGQLLAHDAILEDVAPG